ncbi:MAG TPA: SGNH/GDSL hydrolase family protein [Verrucomicrobiae bacterium]|jgi:lysophospholipase L1-like esterase|nr:SGNH/GDSL hydrolase family protein [Verrucomicrobiae bacterium]
MKRWIKLFCLVALALIPSMAVRGALGKLGAMGDSLTDEYWDSGVSTYASNWVSILVQFRAINMGPTAAQAGMTTWGSPRDAGYEYNWAPSGATSAELLAEGQATGLAAQAGSDGVSNAVLDIGSNDFNPAETNAYDNIYGGAWTSAQTKAYVNQIVSNVETALVTAKADGISVVLGNILDSGISPTIDEFYGNAAERQRVSAAIQNANSGLKNLAQKYQVPYMDWYGLGAAVFGSNTSLRSTILIGNVSIDLRGIDPGPPHLAPTNAFVSDGFHPNTVIQELFANLILQAFNSSQNDNIPLFSEQEILTQASIPFGETNTLESEIGPYSKYVTLPTLPEFTGIHFSGSNLVLSFSTVSNQTYIVEDRNDLIAGSWTALTNNVGGAGGVVTVNDSPPANLPERFYRVRQLP